MGKRSDSPDTPALLPKRLRETEVVSSLLPTESPVYYYDDDIDGRRIQMSKETYYTLLIDALKTKFEPILLTSTAEDPATVRRRKIKTLMSMR